MSDDKIQLNIVSHLCQTLDCRSFWRAVTHDPFVSPTHVADEKCQPFDFERARVHPKFLHSNATSHKWVFGAIAELLDNAVDEICHSATFIKVDKIINFKDNSPALLFHDDGGGMDPQNIRNCMSLGFSLKKTSGTIGQYGNGFKTSTMRLGADVIVFSCSSCAGHSTRSIGLLSYTYLAKTVKNDIIVPILDFEVADGKAGPLPYGSQNDWNFNLKAILDWSPFTTEEELALQFKDMGCHGTKIIVYNLWHDDDDRLELDFDVDGEDIQLRDRAKVGNFSQVRSEIMESHVSFTHRYSLRAYASILYLKKFPLFSIVLRGKPVEQLSIAGEMKFLKTVSYRPYVGKDESVEMTIGFAKEAPVLGLYGFNIYHRNRLIMPFWQVFQEGSIRGKCVIGVLEANFMEPAHDKQDFERSTLFNRLETKLKQMTTEYWKTHCHLIGYKSVYIEKQKQSKPAPRPNVAHEAAVNQPARRPPTCSQQPLIQEHVILRNTSELQSAAGLTSGIPNETPEPSCGFLVINSSAAGGSDTLLHKECILPFNAASMQEDVANDDESVSLLDRNSINVLSEENARLFMKREQHQRVQAELKHQIEILEGQLREVRTKCSKIALEVDAQKSLQVGK